MSVVIISGSAGLIGSESVFFFANKGFEIVGRWERDISGMNYNYDFW